MAESKAIRRGKALSRIRKAREGKVFKHTKKEVRVIRKNSLVGG